MVSTRHFSVWSSSSFFSGCPCCYCSWGGASLIILLQLRPQCEVGRLEVPAAIGCIWAGKPCFLHMSWIFRNSLRQDLDLEAHDVSQTFVLIRVAWCHIFFLFALIISTEAIETSAAINRPLEVSNCLPYFITSPGVWIFRIMSFI